MEVMEEGRRGHIEGESVEYLPQGSQRRGQCQEHLRCRLRAMDHCYTVHIQPPRIAVCSD